MLLVRRSQYIVIMQIFKCSNVVLYTENDTNLRLGLVYTAWAPMLRNLSTLLKRSTA